MMVGGGMLVNMALSVIITATGRYIYLLRLHIVSLGQFDFIQRSF